jgi:hypothetical protein
MIYTASLAKYADPLLDKLDMHKVGGSWCFVFALDSGFRQYVQYWYLLGGLCVCGRLLAIDCSEKTACFTTATTSKICLCCIEI